MTRLESFSNVCFQRYFRKYLEWKFGKRMALLYCEHYEQII